MSMAPFWYLDDEQRVRWAVRVSRAAAAFEPDAAARIVFTSLDQQIATAYPLEKEQSELTRYELLELLTRAKLEEFARSRAVSGRAAVAA